ncbi:MAG: hypothetical protein R3A49_01330 [Acidimicrobiia bacterium]
MPVLALVVALSSPAAAADWDYAQPGTPTELAQDGTIWRAASSTPDGSGVVFYGGDILGLPNGSPASGAMWLYNGSWSAICGTTVSGADSPCAPGPRSASGMAPAGTGVTLYGGSPIGVGNDGGGPVSMDDDTWNWNGSTWTQVCDGCAPGRRSGPAMASSADLSHVILFGGATLDGGDLFPDGTWRYDAGSGSWTQICGTDMTPSDPCGPDGRWGASMAWDGTRFVMFGGSQGFGPADTYFDDTWTFDPVAETWTQVCGSSIATPCGPTRRIYGSLVSLPDASPPGALLVGGGFIGVEPPPPDDGPRGDTWYWDGSGWSELQTFDPGCGVLFPNGASIGGETAVLVGARTSSTGIASIDSLLGGWDLPGGSVCGDAAPPEPPDPPDPPGPTPPDPDGPSGPGGGSGDGTSGGSTGEGTGPSASPTLPATGPWSSPAGIALVALLAVVGGGVLVRRSVVRRSV